MLWLKMCPRCTNGDLYGDHDAFGSYISCLQCGYYLTEAEEVILHLSLRRNEQASRKPVEKESAALGSAH
ncbi:MAG: hypothetical protein HYX82_04245 [Chloroflexi bacterium]|nr:hypothetical protein [Chloroflexota bacterium]